MICKLLPYRSNVSVPSIFSFIADLKRILFNFLIGIPVLSSTRPFPDPAAAASYRCYVSVAVVYKVYQRILYIII